MLSALRLALVALTALGVAAFAAHRASVLTVRRSSVLLPCIARYVLPGRTGERVYIEIDLPPNGRCELDIRVQLARRDPHAEP